MVKDLPAPVEKRWESTLRCNDKKELSQGKEWYKEEFGSHFWVGEKLQDFFFSEFEHMLPKKGEIVWGILEMKCYALLYCTTK
jgi:hypothetical protein